MSRHKMIKNLDLDDEMDDYDGGEDYADESAQELGAEDQEQMRRGTAAVRAAIGNDVPDVTDKEIQDALWHYYYDVGKSVDYLLSSRMVKEKPVKKKKGGSAFLFLSYAESGAGAGGVWSNNNGFAGNDLDPAHSVQHVFKPSIPSDFWSDMQWLNTCPQRQARLIAPLLPRGGLLGGAPEGVPKMSKLQALAAARKKKSQEQKSSSSSEGVDTPMAGLTLTSRTGTTPRPVSNDGAEEIESPELLVSSRQRSYPVRKRKSSSPHARTPQPIQLEQPAAAAQDDESARVPTIEQAPPSAFANTMFGSHRGDISASRQVSLFELPYIQDTNITSIQGTNAFSGPSPDDVVIAAQSKAALAKSTKAPARTNGEKKAAQIANNVETLRLDDTPRAKSKNLDVLAEYEKSAAKNAANFVVIGHVDAGKSTLMGRLLYDLDVVDKRTIDKYRKDAENMGKSSFALAWVLDQGTEERSRGVTIDIAMNKFETAKTSFTILDAPGHRDFIPNMIAGAAQADFAILVIDASTGSFESGLKGQTKEHALLVRSMGVQRLIIAVNKLDTVAWAQDRFEEISQQVSAFLLAAGFQSKNLTFIPMSGLLGDNIVKRASSPDAAWYTGPSLVEELDNSEPVSRALDKPLRFTVGDIFRGGVQNPLSVSGRVDSGTLQTGDALLAQPAGEKCFVRSLEVDNLTTDWAVAGQNVSIHLSDIDAVHLKIGDVLCSPREPVPCIREFTAKVLAFEHVLPGGVDVHRGRLHAEGKIRDLVASLDKVSGTVIKKRPRVLKPASVARVMVELEREVPLEKGMRVVLRSGGETVAAGLLE